MLVTQEGWWHMMNEMMDSELPLDLYALPVYGMLALFGWSMYTQFDAEERAAMHIDHAYLHMVIMLRQSRDCEDRVGHDLARRGAFFERGDDTHRAVRPLLRGAVPRPDPCRRRG